MAVVAKPNTFSAGAVIIASEHNANFDTLYNLVNGALDTTNLASNAAIVDTQLAQITTTSKVAVSALTAFSNLTTVTGLSTDYLVISDTSDSGNSKKALASDFTFTPSASNALAGSVVQVVNTRTGAVATGTTVIPNDDTIPTITEGDEYMTRTVTASSATNKFKIDVVIVGSIDTNSESWAGTLCQDAITASLACASAGDVVSGAQPTTLAFTHFMTTGSTSEITFRVRAGFETGTGTFTFNGSGGARKYGGVLASSITVTEIKV